MVLNGSRSVSRHGSRPALPGTPVTSHHSDGSVTLCSLGSRVSQPYGEQCSIPSVRHGVEPCCVCLSIRPSKFVVCGVSFRLWCTYHRPYSDTASRPVCQFSTWLVSISSSLEWSDETLLTLYRESRDTTHTQEKQWWPLACSQHLPEAVAKLTDPMSTAENDRPSPAIDTA